MANKRYDQFPTGTYNTAKIFLQADGATGALEKINLPSADTLLPGQAGNSGKFLQTNGTTSSWASALTSVDTTANYTWTGTNKWDNTWRKRYLQAAASPGSTIAIGGSFELFGTTGPHGWITILPDGAYSGSWATGWGLAIGHPSFSWIQLVGSSVSIQGSAGSFTTPTTLNIGSFFTLIQSSPNFDIRWLDLSSWNFRLVKGTSREMMRVNGADNFLIGSTTNIPSSKLTVTSTTQGVLFPTMTSTQKNAISAPAEGLIVYDTTLHKLCLYTGSAWETITSS